MCLVLLQSAHSSSLHFLLDPAPDAGHRLILEAAADGLTQGLRETAWIVRLQEKTPNQSVSTQSVVVVEDYERQRQLLTRRTTTECTLPSESSNSKLNKGASVKLFSSSMEAPETTPATREVAYVDR